LFSKKKCGIINKTANFARNKEASAMSAAYNFRTSFNGFHREDVVHYIEYINTKNAAQLSQLKADLAALQQENAKLKSSAGLEEQVAQLKKELEQANQARAELEKELAEKSAQLDKALNSQQEVKRSTDAELEAYRRAERMERQAQERTDAMYQKATAVISATTAKVDSAALQVSSIADQVAGQLATLQQAIASSKISLNDAAATLYAIRPQE
jgi:chromosome segregation ATPase